MRRCFRSERKKLLWMLAEKLTQLSAKVGSRRSISQFPATDIRSRRIYLLRQLFLAQRSIDPFVPQTLTRGHFIQLFHDLDPFRLQSSFLEMSTIQKCYYAASIIASRSYCTIGCAFSYCNPKVGVVASVIQRYAATFEGYRKKPYASRLFALTMLS